MSTLGLTLSLAFALTRLLSPLSSLQASLATEVKQVNQASPNLEASSVKASGSLTKPEGAAPSDGTALASTLAPKTPAMKVRGSIKSYEYGGESVYEWERV